MSEKYVFCIKQNSCNKNHKKLMKFKLQNKPQSAQPRIDLHLIFEKSSWLNLIFGQDRT